MSERRMRPALVALAVVAIGLVAVVLRIWKLRWGLRHGMAFTDELQLWPSYLEAFIPLRPESFVRADGPAALLYPSFYGFLVAAAVAITHAAGFIPSPSEDVYTALYVARLVAATAGLANVALVGVLAWRIASPRAGLLAAALMAVVPVESMQGHYVSVDPLLGACVTLALLFACTLATTGTVPVAFAAGAAAGLAFGAKYTGLVAFGACGWAILEVCARERSVGALFRLLPVALAGFLVFVALACPPCVLQSELMFRAIEGLSHISSSSYLAFWNVHLLPTLGWYGRPYLYQLVAGFPFALGWPFYFASIAGVARGVARRETTDRVLLVTLAAVFVSVGMSFVLEAPRYYIPMVPILVVLTARLLDEMRARRVALAIFAAVWLYTGALTLSQVMRYSYAQQMQLANWIKDTMPPWVPGTPRTRVAYPGGLDPYYGLRQPLLWANLTPVVAPSGQWFDERPEFFVMPELTAVRLERDQPDSVDAQALRRLVRGETEYRPVRTWRSHYLQSDLYTWLDPVFVGDYAQGEIGFTVYMRGDLADAHRAGG